MADNATAHVIRGELHWAKVLGQPKMNTFTEVREYSVDVTPDAKGRAELKRIGISDKLREPKPTDTRKDSFISFRQKEFRIDPKTGENIKIDPIKVTDVTGAAWPQDRMIGNKTIADVKFRYKDYGKGKPKGVYIQAIRVLKLVPYETQEFAPISEDDEFFAQGSLEETPVAETAVETDMEDDIPF